MPLRCLLACAAALMICPAAADESPARTREQSAADERRLQIIGRTADAYTLYDAGSADQPLTRSEKPLLRFDDPVTLAAQGAVYVWLDQEKRPLAIASIYFRGGDGARVDEFQSLAVGNLVARYQDAVVWRPSQPGVAWTNLPGDVPQRGPLRLAKMRDLARQFAASVSDAKAGRQELRLLPQPLYRYDDVEHGIVDSALFCFAKGTNPEILLLLAAVKGESRTEWRHAFCRMTERECEVKSDGRVVWAVSKAPIPQPPEDPYFNRTTK
jgi:hypothetical protein